jgi:hypothetical protein
LAYQLEELSPDEFLGRPSGAEAGAEAEVDTGAEAAERLLFTRGGDGRAASFQLGGARFARREIGTVGGETFRIDPVRDVEELRIEALAASPPMEEGPFRESQLVDLTSLDPTIELDICYATTNNFMNAVFYEDPRAFLQRPAAGAVATGPPGASALRVRPTDTRWVPSLVRDEDVLGRHAPPSA